MADMTVPPISGMRNIHVEWASVCAPYRRTRRGKRYLLQEKEAGLTLQIKVDVGHGVVAKAGCNLPVGYCRRNTVRPAHQAELGEGQLRHGKGLQVRKLKYAPAARSSVNHHFAFDSLLFLHSLSQMLRTIIRTKYKIL